MELTPEGSVEGHIQREELIGHPLIAKDGGRPGEGGPCADRLRDLHGGKVDGIGQDGEAPLCADGQHRGHPSGSVDGEYGVLRSGADAHRPKFRGRDLGSDIPPDAKPREPMAI